MPQTQQSLFLVTQQFLISRQLSPTTVVLEIFYLKIGLPSEILQTLKELLFIWDILYLSMFIEVKAKHYFILK